MTILNIAFTGVFKKIAINDPVSRPKKIVIYNFVKFFILGEHVFDND